MKITPAMITAMSAPLPNFHGMWKQYVNSDFRRQWLNEWAGDNIEKQRAVQKILSETVPR